MSSQKSGANLPATAEQVNALLAVLEHRATGAQIRTAQHILERSAKLIDAGKPLPVELRHVVAAVLRQAYRGRTVVARERSQTSDTETSALFSGDKKNPKRAECIAATFKLLELAGVGAPVAVTELVKTLGVSREYIYRAKRHSMVKIHEGLGAESIGYLVELAAGLPGPVLGTLLKARSESTEKLRRFLRAGRRD